MRLKALILSCALVAGELVRAQVGPVERVLPPTRDQFFSLFQGYVETLRLEAGIPGMASAIIGDTDVLWAQSFGVSDVGSVAATRTDTPFQLDGLTGLVTTTMLLQCVEQGSLNLDSRIGTFAPSSPDPNLTIAQLLTQTTGTAGNLTYSFNSSRLDLLKFPVETCSRLTFRQAFTKTLQRLGMMESVPGLDAADPTLSNADLATAADADRYRGILRRLALPYSVNPQGVAALSVYPARTLSGASGLISTVFDFAKFDLALKQGILLRPQTLAAAWTNPVNSNGQALPHGIGWFVQNYNGETVVWQFGAEANAASSLVLTLPNRNITLVLVANSDGLSKPASLTAGDVTVSPFAKVFLGLVVK